jgi:hypothetical protein
MLVVQQQQQIVGCIQTISLLPSRQQQAVKQVEILVSTFVLFSFQLHLFCGLSF